MSPLQVGSRVEVWERRGQSERLCYVGVITGEDHSWLQVKHDAASVCSAWFGRSGLRQLDNARRYLKAVQS